MASETVYVFKRFNDFIKNQKRDFLRFLSRCTRFLEHRLLLIFLFTFLHFLVLCCDYRTAAGERTLNWRHVQGRICVCGGAGQDHY